MAGPSSSGLAAVKRIIAVSSCKGGVGKSMVALNLAAALRRRSSASSVGIYDADVHGPSLPTMVVPQGSEWAAKQDEATRMICPIEAHGLKCMSYGFVGPGTGGRRHANASLAVGGSSGEAVMRGQLASRTVISLLEQTDWGELDYLVIDLPPGTSDVHLTLCQSINVDGAVVVTTPAHLSYVDVVKGISMLSALKVPTIAAVENMAWMDVPGASGERVYPFGESDAKKIKNVFGIENTVSVPIMQEASACADSGKLLTDGTSEASIATAKLFDGLAAGVTQALDALTEAMPPSVNFVEGRGIVARFFSDSGAEELIIPPIEFRRKLSQVDDMLSVDPDTIDPDVIPTNVIPQGNYAIAIQWSDGHEGSIYTYDEIRRIGREVMQQHK